MISGMLWFDNDQKFDLIEKVCKAARYYQEKYGQNPDLCYVHPDMLSASGETNGKESIKAENIEIKSSPNVLPNHFWIGVDTG